MKIRYIDFRWWRLLFVLTLLLLLLLLVATSAAANQIPDDLMYITVCRTPAGHPENAQTLMVYWSALDKSLCCMHDTIGQCQ